MGNSVASIQYIASILKKKKLCLDTSPLTNGYNKAERVWNVAKLKFTIKDNIPRNTTPLVLFLYLEPHNNQKQLEISKRKSLITNTFYKLTLFGCFLSLPKFPHIFDTYF